MRKVFLLGLFFFFFSCKQKEEKPVHLEKPCPDISAFAQKVQSLLKEDYVLVAGLKTKGNLCAYTVLLGPKASPVSFYYTNGVIIMGIGYEEVGSSFEPFYADYGLGRGEKSSSPSTQGR